MQMLPDVIFLSTIYLPLHLSRDVSDLNQAWWSKHALVEVDSSFWATKAAEKKTKTFGEGVFPITITTKVIDTAWSRLWRSIYIILSALMELRSLTSHMPSADESYIVFQTYFQTFVKDFFSSFSPLWLIFSFVVPFLPFVLFMYFTNAKSQSMALLLW